ncbi:MAG: leucine-rich repeat domain-containing protein [Promethearchaeota archaeon]|nr:MAG: leucine-rich repeat domain-containing protein [Candidatus Lokiarchaeota archaeon]
MNDYIVLFSKSKIKTDIKKINNFKMYKWNLECYRCYKKVPVATYYFYQNYFHNLGDIEKLDKKMIEIYPFIKYKYDKEIGKKEVANYCVYCGIKLNNGYLIREFLRELRKHKLRNYVDKEILNNLKEKDLKTKVYENYGLNLEEVNCLKDLEKLLGRTLPIIEKKDCLNGIYVEDNHVVGLNLVNSNLKVLPETIGNLTHLKKLNLDSNYLKSLPDSFENLTSLELLSLTFNPLRNFPLVLTKLKSLKELVLINNHLEELPDAIGNLTSLEKLTIHLNHIKIIPSTIGNLQSLKEVSLLYLDIEELPDSFGNLKSLEYLRLGDKNALSFHSRIRLNFIKFRRLPESFKNLTSLKVLEVFAGGMNELPESVINLSSLKSIKFNNKVIKKSPIEKSDFKGGKKNIYSDDVEVSFITMGKNQNLIEIDDKKEQLEDLYKWGWIESKWEKSDDDIIFPYDEIFIIPSVEILDFTGFPQGSLNQPLPKIKQPRWLKLKRVDGIRVKDIREAIYNHLPDYGDFHFFESLKYRYDYDGIPVYFLFIGS